MTDARWPKMTDLAVRSSPGEINELQLVFAEYARDARCVVRRRGSVSDSHDGFMGGFGGGRAGLRFRAARRLASGER